MHSSENDVGDSNFYKNSGREAAADRLAGSENACAEVTRMPVVVP